jgi:hypothetical protein
MMGDAAKLLGLLAFHLVLTGLPGVAAGVLAIRSGIRQVAVILGVGLAATGVTAMLAFWGYFGDPQLGRVIAYAIAIASIAVIAWCARSIRRQPDLGRELLSPLMLWVLGSGFLVFLGFLHGGTHDPLVMSQTRFSHPLPTDNQIPLYFSNWYYAHGHHGVPPAFPGGWLSSDRPPLQVGYVLAQRTFGWDVHGLNYQVLGVVLQQLWIVALWALLAAARVVGRTRALVMAAVLLSDIAIVHGFFVWPKMLAATFVIAAAALVVAPGSTSLRAAPGSVILFGCLCALAMLAHGASAFGVIALAIVALIRGLPAWQWIVAGALAVALLWIPWTEYQRAFDPPGNRIEKWMLAGDTGFDHKSTTGAIWGAYRGVGFSGALHDKAENLNGLTGGDDALDRAGNAITDLTSGDVAGGFRQARIIRFLWFVPWLGIFLVAPFVMLARRAQAGERDADWWLAKICLGIAGIGLLAWVLLLFGSPLSGTSLHQGSFAVPLLALCGAVAALRAAFPRAATIVVSANALAVLVLYTPALGPGVSGSYSVPAALLAILALAGFLWVCLRDEMLAPANAASERPSPAPVEPSLETAGPARGS